MVQFIDNGKYDFTEDTDENDYDRLLPRGEFEHLCMCTYGRVDGGTEAGENGGHLTTLQM